jgi:hypothetical protein
VNINDKIHCILETVAGILRLWWTGRTFPFILPVQPFSEEGQL